MSFVIITDTREQRPYTFGHIIPRPAVEVATLKTGDYSVKGFETQIAIERKSLSDAYGTFGQGRERFERELKRLAEYQFAAVIIEADWDTALLRRPPRSRMLPKSFLCSVLAWQARYRIHFMTPNNRELAEKMVYHQLRLCWKEVNNES